MRPARYQDDTSIAIPAKSDRKRFALIAFVLGTAIAAMHVVGHSQAVPLRYQLSTFPLALGTWQGQDEELPSRIVKSLHVDDYVNRLYQDEHGHIVGLYVGYYENQKTGESIHSPKNCLPGSGWEPIRSGRELLSRSPGNQVSVNLYLIQKGLDRQLVLYWYQSNGRIIASEYWAKIYLVLDGIRLNRTASALVRISTPMEDGETAARQRAANFAETVLNPLGGLLPN